MCGCWTGSPRPVAALAQQYPLMILTKGELFDQETKVARSGIADYFRYVEVVSDKTEATYAAVLARHQIDPARFLMVGNSLRSDILPVTAIGGQAVYVPYALTWAHEAVGSPEGERQYEEVASIRELPGLIAAMQRMTSGGCPVAGSLCSMGWEIDFLSTHRVARLATVGADGQPHLVPIVYAFDGQKMLYPHGWKAQASCRPGAAPCARYPGQQPGGRLAGMRYRGVVTAGWPGSGSGPGEAVFLEAAGSLYGAAGLSLLGEKYPQYREMRLEGRPLIMIDPVQVRSWRAAPQSGVEQSEPDA